MRATRANANGTRDPVLGAWSQAKSFHAAEFSLLLLIFLNLVSKT